MSETREAIELYRRERFVARVNAGYAKLREDPEAWETYRTEQDAWDPTLEDGLPKTLPAPQPRRKQP